MRRRSEGVGCYFVLADEEEPLLPIPLLPVVPLMVPPPLPVPLAPPSEPEPLLPELPDPLAPDVPLFWPWPPLRLARQVLNSSENFL